MNNKGFTLIELLAVIIVLSIIGGLTFSIVGGNFAKAKESTEEVFVDTIRDALDVYLTSSDAKGLDFEVVKDASGNECLLKKTHGDVKIYKVTTSFQAVIDSEYHPIGQDDLVNPSNEEVSCANASNISVDVYRDDDYVYYYSVNKMAFVCLKNIGTLKETLEDGTKVYYSTKISNLPEGFRC